MALHTENSEVFTDYLGNEIEDGMTIYVVRKKPFYTHMYGSDKWCTSTKTPKECWEVICEYKVYFDKDFNLLFATTIGKVRISESLKGLFKSIDFDSQCIAIKGISDRKETLK